MTPFQVIIETPEDLNVLADVLEDNGFTIGVQIVRYMIQEERFPRSNKKRGFCWWRCGNYSSSVKHSLPRESITPLIIPHIIYPKYFTATQAVWSVIMAGKFLPPEKESK